VRWDGSVARDGSGRGHGGNPSDPGDGRGTGRGVRTRDDIHSDAYGQSGESARFDSGSWTDRGVGFGGWTDRGVRFGSWTDRGVGFGSGAWKG
jgi:hypothetical protein